MPKSVTPIIPAKTAVPRVRRISAPAPWAITSGSTPRMNANDVMTIGRSRTLAASTAASNREDPRHRQRPALIQAGQHEEDQHRPEHERAERVLPQVAELLDLAGLLLQEAQLGPLGGHGVRQLLVRKGFHRPQ